MNLPQRQNLTGFFEIFLPLLCSFPVKICSFFRILDHSDLIKNLPSRFLQEE